MSKKRRIITYLSVGLILGFVTYYIVEVVVKLLNKHTLKEALISTKGLPSYLAATISGGVNGVLLLYLPSALFPMAAVFSSSVIFLVILAEAGEDFGTLEDFGSALIRDLFLTYFILYIISFFQPNKSNSKDRSFGELLSVTLASSIALNLSLAYTRFGVDLLTGISGGVEDDIIV